MKNTIRKILKEDRKERFYNIIIKDLISDTEIIDITDDFGDVFLQGIKFPFEEMIENSLESADRNDFIEYVLTKYGAHPDEVAHLWTLYYRAFIEEFGEEFA